MVVADTATNPVFLMASFLEIFFSKKSATGLFAISLGSFSILKELKVRHIKIQWVNVMNSFNLYK